MSFFIAFFMIVVMLLLVVVARYLYDIREKIESMGNC